MGMEAIVVFVVVAAGFGLAALGMGVGAMTRGKCLRGSCGGPQVRGPDGLPISCAGCPRRARDHGR